MIYKKRIHIKSDGMKVLFIKANDEMVKGMTSARRFKKTVMYLFLLDNF